MTDLLETLEHPEAWDWEAAVTGEDRPLVVAYDIKEVLEGIRNDVKSGVERLQTGIDAANGALALKADKTDLEAAKRGLHERIDKTDDRVAQMENSMARAAGWRAGFLVTLGIFAGLLTGLGMHALKLV